MIETKLPRHPRSPVTFVIILSLAGCALLSQVPGFFASTRHQPSLPSVLPDDIQLINADTKPTLRIPVAHFTQTMLAGPFNRLTGGFGWLEISRDTVRYTAMEPLHVGHYGNATKETDIGFEYARSELSELKMLYSNAIYPVPDHSVQVHVQKKLRHYFAYYSQAHWPLDRKSFDKMQKVDGVYTPLILRALQDFDGTVADCKLKQRASAPVPPPEQPPVAPAPQPAAPAPAPPAIVVTAPAGASANGVVNVDASSVTIRGVAMDSTGLPNVTINGMPAALRPSSSEAVEFWSDPIALKPGDNSIHISASSVAHVETKLGFTVRCTPKAAPANPNALTKAEIISLLVGAVPASRVAEIVTSRGIKFIPNTDDLNEIRAAGGTDDLLDAIQRTAPH